MKKIVLALLLTVIFTAPAFSQMMNMPMKEQGKGPMTEMSHPGMTGDMSSCMGMMGACMDKMGLSDDQTMKLKPLHRDMEKKHARFQADVKIAEIELMEIMDVKDFDLKKAGAAVKKIADIKTAYHLEMLKAMKEMRAILTDEQFKKMARSMMMHMKMGGMEPAHKMMMQHP